MRFEKSMYKYEPFPVSFWVSVILLQEFLPWADIGIIMESQRLGFPEPPQNKAKDHNNSQLYNASGKDHRPHGLLHIAIILSLPALHRNENNHHKLRHTHRHSRHYITPVTVLLFDCNYRHQYRQRLEIFDDGCRPYHLAEGLAWEDDGCGGEDARLGDGVQGE